VVNTFFRFSCESVMIILLIITWNIRDTIIHLYYHTRRYIKSGSLIILHLSVDHFHETSNVNVVSCIYEHYYSGCLLKSYYIPCIRCLVYILDGYIIREHGQMKNTKLNYKLYYSLCYYHCSIFIFNVN